MNKKHHIIKSFGYAIEGIKMAWKYNVNFRIHIVAGYLAIMLGIWLNLTRTEMAMIILTVMAVIGAEMINSAVEEVVNLVSKKYSQEAKIAKDVGAGMVLVGTIGSVIIGTLIFLPYILPLIQK